MAISVRVEGPSVSGGRGKEGKKRTAVSIVVVSGPSSSVADVVGFRIVCEGSE
jgi:hypothetical protein